MSQFCRRDVIAGPVGSTYPHGSKIYMRLLQERLCRYRKFIEMKAPVTIIRRNRQMVREAAVGVIFPWLENWRRRRQDQEFLDGLCRKINGWSWCKLERDHQGDCVFEWRAAADLAAED